MVCHLVKRAAELQLLKPGQPDYGPALANSTITIIPSLKLALFPGLHHSIVACSTLQAAIATVRAWERGYPKTTSVPEHTHIREN